MASIVVLQEQHRLWVERNFPDQQPHDALLGIVEEVGELAHAHLKMQQGIRGVEAAKISDALGDIFIYMLSYCNTNGYDLNACIEAAWAEVALRDWVQFPINGIDV